jgi:hypothetical protein
LCVHAKFNSRRPFHRRAACALRAQKTPHAQSILEDMLDWLAAEHKRRDELLARISKLAPLDHRMQELVEEEKESLLRIGQLDHMLAALTQSLFRLDRNLSDAVERSREAIAPPRERKNDERQQ